MNIAGSRIKECRVSCHMTQQDVARYLGVTKQTVYKYESGIVTNIPIIHMEQMGKLFQVPPAYLAGWLDELPNPSGLSRDEYLLISMYRELPLDGKKLLLQQAKANQIIFGK